MTKDISIKKSHDFAYYYFHICIEPDLQDLQLSSLHD